MALLGTTFDASQIEPSTPFEVLPAGRYHVQIVNSEMRTTKDGTGQYLWLELSIMDGPHTNKRLFDRLNLENNNPQAVEIAHRTLSAICHATGVMSVNNSEQLHHKSLIANVRVRPAGPDKNGINREASNEIGGYLPMNGSQPAVVAGAATRPATVSAMLAAAPAQAATSSAPPWKRSV